MKSTKGMLGKLGRRLTVLNVVISSLILVTMALVSLSVTEGMMSRQHEDELGGYLGTLSMAVNSIRTDGDAVRIQVPQQFGVFIEDGDIRNRLIVNDTMSRVVAKEIVPEMRKEFDEIVDIQPVSDGESIVAKKQLFVAVSDKAKVKINTGEEISSDRVQMTLTTVEGEEPNAFYLGAAQKFKISTVGDKEYRIAMLSESTGDPDRQSMMLVVQDRTGELAERNRLRVLFALCVAGGIALIIAGSLFYSAQAVKPIEQAMQKQQEFVWAASHELRTPIAAVRANAEVLRDAALGAYTPYLGAIQSESEKMSSLVTGLLDLARVDAGQSVGCMELVELEAVISDVVELIEPMAQERGLTLHATLASAPMSGDVLKVRQIFIAIVENAVGYTKENGRVWIETHTRSGFAEAIISDDGDGIADEHKARIFDRFYRVESARSRENGGAGLGLSIAKEMTNAMNGQIEVTDRQGGGTQFTIRFPVAKG